MVIEPYARLLRPSGTLVRVRCKFAILLACQSDRSQALISFICARSNCRDEDLLLSKVYQLLEPGPVVLLTTACNGRANVMTISWHMMVEFEPPLVACVVSSASHSFAALRATKECGIAVPALELAPKVVKVGNCSGRNVDKFKRFGLTQAPAKHVSPPLMAQCFANP